MYHVDAYQQIPRAKPSLRWTEDSALASKTSRGLQSQSCDTGLSTNFQAQAEGMTTDKIIVRLLKDIKEPNVPKYASIDTK